MSTISASTTSTTAYKVTADTTGALVLQTGATPTTAMTIDTSQNTTLAGTLTTSAKGIAKASLPAGVVLQVVQTQYSTATTTTSSAQTSTGCTASITPSSSTNKVLAILNMPTRHNSVGQNGAGQISRNSGAALSGLVQDYYAPSGTGVSGNINIVWLDSPATTSSVTYTATFGVNGSGGTLAINSDYNNTNNGVTYLTLLEISA